MWIIDKWRKLAILGNKRIEHASVKPYSDRFESNISIFISVVEEYFEKIFRLLCINFVVFYSILLINTNVYADAPLSISVSRPLTGYLAAIMGSGRFVYLDGEIDSSAGRRLEKFIITNDISPTSTIVLNSPGGSLLGGIEIGKIIRKYGFATDIGKRVARDGRDSYDPGQCMSACTMAFIGGRFRYLSKGSRLGVHRFYFETAGLHDADMAQIISAAVVNHIKDMNIDIGLFELTTKSGKDEMLEPDRDTLIALQVLNNGFGNTSWTIEGKSNLIYLKGERDTVYGINKFIIYCGNGNVILHAIFDPQGRTEEVMGLGAHSLVIDHKDEPIMPDGRQIKNG